MNSTNTDERIQCGCLAAEIFGKSGSVEYCYRTISLQYLDRKYSGGVSKEAIVAVWPHSFMTWVVVLVQKSNYSDSRLQGVWIFSAKLNAMCCISAPCTESDSERRNVVETVPPRTVNVILRKRLIERRLCTACCCRESCNTNH